jgi:serine/threonine-protein kinase
MTCPRCAKHLATDSRFCPQCGTATGSPTSFATVAMATPSTSSSTFDEGRFPPGTLLADRYRIVALLGKGGMGEVYRANDLKLAQAVAMKFLPSNDLRMVERFRSEVRIARQVSHPNVCRVYDIGEAEGRAFLTMKYVDGEDLASLLRRIGGLPHDKALEITRKLCAGLAAAHDKGVLHRDLKPANVMIDGRGQVLITDFGLPGLIGQVRDITSGTPAYMAPQQRAGREVSVRSDIDSLALVMGEMFPEKDLDPAIDRVIHRCLDDDPKLRPGFPMTLDFSAWYSGSTVMALGAILLLAGFAFQVARTGRTA